MWVKPSLKVMILADGLTAICFFVDCEAREIMYLVASVRLSDLSG